MEKFTLAEMVVGQEASFKVLLTEKMLDAFAALSGDENPLHMDAAYALANGFKGRVAHGLLTSAFYSRLVGMYLPGERALLHGVDVLFVAPAYPGQELTVSGKVVYVNEAYGQVEIKGEIRDTIGLVSRAKIKVGVRS